jgi:hypothetical protein
MTKREIAIFNRVISHGCTHHDNEAEIQSILYDLYRHKIRVRTAYRLIIEQLDV